VTRSPKAVADARLVCFSAVTWWTHGTRLPVADLVDVAHDAGALALVDAVQVPGQLSMDVGEWGADAVGPPPAEVAPRALGRRVPLRRPRGRRGARTAGRRLPQRRDGTADDLRVRGRGPSFPRSGRRTPRPTSPWARR